MLALITSSMENPASVHDRLRALGPLHNSKGVKAEHAIRMGASLQYCLQKVLADDYVAEVPHEVVVMWPASSVNVYGSLSVMLHAISVSKQFVVENRVVTWVCMHVMSCILTFMYIHRH